MWLENPEINIVLHNSVIYLVNYELHVFPVVLVRLRSVFSLVIKFNLKD